MATAQEIIESIQSNLAHMRGYNDWTIGICRNPRRTQQQRDDPPFFRSWTADSDEEAARVVEVFVKQGMRRDDDARAGDCIYLF